MLESILGEVWASGEVCHIAYHFRWQFPDRGLSPAQEYTHGRKRAGKYNPPWYIDVCC